MRRSSPRTIAALVAMLATTLLATVAAGAVASPAPGQGGTRPAPAVTVRLITGDRVLLRLSAPHPSVAVLARSRHGVAGAITTYAHDGTIEVLPAAARRYLGSVLDPSLFDVTALARRGSTGRVPVVLTARPGSNPHVPGLTVVSRRGATVHGYFTARGTDAFGAALAARWRADVRAHRLPATLFGGVTAIAAPGAVVARPAFPQLTLTVHVIAPSGRPAGFADVALTDVDDGRKFTQFVSVVRGLAKISVPVGNYSGLAEWDTFGPGGISSYFVPLEQVPVTGSGASMTFDMRTATAVPSVQTPRPAGVLSQTVEWDRDTRFSSLSIGTQYDGGAHLHVAPSAPATEGTLHWLEEWQLAANPASGAPYSYDLAFDSAGQVPADQTHTVAPGDLTTIDSRYYTDHQARVAVYGRGVFFPFQFFVFTSLFPLQTPVRRLEYVNDPPGAQWSASLLAAPSNRDPFQGEVDDVGHTYQPGTSVRADWLRGPLAPGMQQPAPDTTAFACYYCREPRSMSLFFAPFTDSTPGHAGHFDVPFRGVDAAHFTLYADGRRIDSMRNSTGDLVRVPERRTTYRAVVTAQRGVAGFATSTAARTVVRWVSSATSGPKADPDWFCLGRPATCTVPPLLTASVPLPTTLDDTMPTGSQTVTFTVGHVIGAAQSPLVDVRFAVSPDEGQTFYSLPVTPLGGGRYQVTIDNRPGWSGRGIGIRVAADDTVGGSLTETVLDAYTVTQG